jgi:hypothetical protein
MANSRKIPTAKKIPNNTTVPVANRAMMALIAHILAMGGPSDLATLVEQIDTVDPQCANWLYDQLRKMGVFK